MYRFAFITHRIKILKKDEKFSLIIPDCVDIVEKKAFYHAPCVAVDSIIIGKKVWSIRSEAFANVLFQYLDFTKAEKLECIGEKAFSCGGYVKEVVLPPSIKKVSPSVFYLFEPKYGSGIEKVVLPSDCEFSLDEGLRETGRPFYEKDDSFCSQHIVDFEGHELVKRIDIKFEGKNYYVIKKITTLEKEEKAKQLLKKFQSNPQKMTSIIESSSQEDLDGFMETYSQQHLIGKYLPILEECLKHRQNEKTANRITSYKRLKKYKEDSKAREEAEIARKMAREKAKEEAELLKKQEQLQMAQKLRASLPSSDFLDGSARLRIYKNWTEAELYNFVDCMSRDEFIAENHRPVDECIDEMKKRSYKVPRYFTERLACFIKEWDRFREDNQYDERNTLYGKMTDADTLLELGDMYLGGYVTKQDKQEAYFHFSRIPQNSPKYKKAAKKMQDLAAENPQIVSKNEVALKAYYAKIEKNVQYWKDDKEYSALLKEYSEVCRHNSWTSLVPDTAYKISLFCETHEYSPDRENSYHQKAYYWFKKATFNHSHNCTNYAEIREKCKELEKNEGPSVTKLWDEEMKKIEAQNREKRIEEEREAAEKRAKEEAKRQALERQTQNLKAQESEISTKAAENVLPKKAWNTNDRIQSLIARDQPSDYEYQWSFRQLGEMCQELQRKRYDKYRQEHLERLEKSANGDLSEAYRIAKAYYTGHRDPDEHDRSSGSCHGDNSLAREWAEIALENLSIQNFDSGEHADNKLFLFDDIGEDYFSGTRGAQKDEDKARMFFEAIVNANIDETFQRNAKHYLKLLNGEEKMDLISIQRALEVSIKNELKKFKEVKVDISSSNFIHVYVTGSWIEVEKVCNVTLRTSGSANMNRFYANARSDLGRNWQAELKEIDGLYSDRDKLDKKEKEAVESWKHAEWKAFESDREKERRVYEEGHKKAEQVLTMIIKKKVDEYWDTYRKYVPSANYKLKVTLYC